MGQEQRYDALIDARGLSCPLPLVKARQALMVLPEGASVCVLATDPAAPHDFEEFVEITGHELREQRVEGGVYLLVLVKRG
ncbi:MAG TPA: sulfurtransferase TusA family protein [Geminicoccaceae bacterium]|nr:sulfurtransferase TusA family protein [Geminicoccaceae bacterium]